MTAVEAIDRVVAARFLSAGLTYIPPSGASEGDLVNLQSALDRRLSAAHANILRRWNGLNLDVLRIYGTEETREIRGLRERQIGPLAEQPGTLVIADDPAGFSYGETARGSIVSYDPDGQSVKTLAPNLDDFLSRLVFGPDAADFGGSDWLAELRAAGIVN